MNIFGTTTTIETNPWFIFGSCMRPHIHSVKYAVRMSASRRDAPANTVIFIERYTQALRHLMHIALSSTTLSHAHCAILKLFAFKLAHRLAKKRWSWPGNISYDICQTPYLTWEIGLAVFLVQPTQTQTVLYAHCTTLYAHCLAI